MPRYFFNICSDAFEETDVIGETCPNDVAALDRALRKASAVLQTRLASESFVGDGWVEVEDERHRPVLTLPLRAAAY
jgi:hypothetical protein